MNVVIDIDENNPDKIKVLEIPHVYKLLIEGIPGFSFTKGFWRGPFSWQSWLALSSDFQDKLIVGDKLTVKLNELYNKVIVPGMSMRQLTDAPGYEGLRSYQKAGVDFLSTVERALLADGLGSGKSRTSFSTIRRLFEQGKDPFPVLIVCPNTTKIGWKRDEIEAVWPGLKVNVIDGTAVQRKKLLNEEAHVYIINWESLRLHSKLKPYGNISLKRCIECGGQDPKVTLAACEVHIKELNNIKFRTVIGDEIHRIIDASSKTARALKAATDDAQFRFGLSATPLSDSPHDMFSILNWLMPEGYPSRTKFIDRFCEKSFSEWGGLEIAGIKESKKQEFFAGFDPFFRRMPKELVLSTLPPIVHMNRLVTMGIKQKKAYTQMVKQMVAEIDGSDELLMETSPLTKVTRLLQFAASYAELDVIDFFDKKKDQWIKKNIVTLSEPSSKLDAFMDDLPDFGEESVVVFAVSSQLINLLSARLTKKEIPHGLVTGAQKGPERQQAMDDFQAGKIKFILCTIGAAKEGITLTAASTMVFLQRPWSMIANEQSEGRSHRIGSEIHERIKIIDYLTENTYETEVIEAIAKKTIQLEYILRDKEFMKRLLLEGKLPTEEEMSSIPLDSRTFIDFVEEEEDEVLVSV
jgi:SNF2 family DNA or RNA helicase